MSDRVKIHIEATNQDTVANWKLEGICVSDAWVAVLSEIPNLKPFQGFSKVTIKFADKERKAEFYYGGWDSGKLIQRDSNSLNFWISESEKESEASPMTHNVTIKKTEKRVIEEYWLMRGIRINASTNAKEVIKECESEKQPTLEQIAQFLSDSNTDFVSVEHNYRFEPDLPFC